jgi:hypothetical protein
MESLANSLQPDFSGPAPQFLSPLPDLYEQALRQNQLLAACCNDCRRTHFPPESRCTHCRSARLEPVALSGRAKLYSAEIGENDGELSLGHIQLAEGFWVRALLVGAFQDPEKLLAALQDKPLNVVPAVLRTHGLAILAFRPG